MLERIMKGNFLKRYWAATVVKGRLSFLKANIQQLWL